MGRRIVVTVLTASLPWNKAVRVQRYIREFRADWTITGRSARTADTYLTVLVPLLAQDEIDLAAVKEWVAEAATPQSRRLRGRAARAFFKWAHTEDVIKAEWWSRIPLANVAETPQQTMTDNDYRATLIRAKSARDKAIVAVLWSSGMRREEVSRMRVEHLDLDGHHVLVPVTKTKRHRVAPLSPEACKLIRVYLRKHPQIGDTGPLWLGVRGPLTAQGVRMVLRHLDAAPAHSWRRGWAVDSLRQGVSQTSVQAAAGWANGTMVTRYTRALAGDLAMTEFERRWSS